MNAQGGSIDEVTIGQSIGIMGRSWLMESDGEDDRNAEIGMSMHAQRQLRDQANWVNNCVAEC